MDHPAAHKRHPSFRVDSLFYGSPQLLSPCRSRRVFFFSGSRWLLSFIALPLQMFSAALSKHNAPRAAGLLRLKAARRHFKKKKKTAKP